LLIYRSFSFGSSPFLYSTPSIIRVVPPFGVLYPPAGVFKPACWLTTALLVTPGGLPAACASASVGPSIK